MLQLLRQADKQTPITLRDDFFRNLARFRKFLPHFNGIAFFAHTNVFSHTELDASLQGMGAVCNNEVYAITIPLNFQGYQIAQLEMLNILVALHVWGPYWKGNCVMIHCDNQTVVTIINSGRTRDTVLAAITRSIAMLTATHDIELCTLHIPDKHNTIADNFSRVALSGQFVENLRKLIPFHIWLQPSAKCA